MSDTRIEVLSDLIAAVRETEPEIHIEIKHDRVLIGFWFSCATGREFVCATAPTFVEAYAKASEKRADKIASAVIEAEVRAEVEARMKAAA